MNAYWLGILLTACFLTSCTEEKNIKETPGITEVAVVYLQPTDTSFHVDYVADIQSVKNVEIRSRTNGYLDRILVDEGASVKKGQLLFQLTNKELLNELNKAKASLQSATAAARITELEMDRVHVLVEKKVIANSELDLARARLDDARARIAEAQATVADVQTRIGYLSVRSPFNGVIDRLPMKAGSLVTDGSLLTTLSDNSEMYAYFDVSENEYLQRLKTAGSLASTEKSATLLLSDGTRYPHKGTIETQEAEFSDNTGSIAYRVRFPNPDATLKHGSSGKIQLLTHLYSKVLVPQKSVLEIQDKSYVFIVGSDSTVKMKSFTPRLRIADYLVVDDGLQAGDAIVYEGIQSMQDGSRIKPRLYSGKLMAAN